MPGVAVTLFLAVDIIEKRFCETLSPVKTTAYRIDQLNTASKQRALEFYVNIVQFCRFFGISIFGNM